MRELLPALDAFLKRESFEAGGDVFSLNSQSVIKNAFGAFLDRFDNVKSRCLGHPPQTGQTRHTSNSRTQQSGQRELEEVGQKLSELYVLLSENECANRSDLL